MKNLGGISCYYFYLLLYVSILINYSTNMVLEETKTRAR